MLQLPRLCCLTISAMLGLILFAFSGCSNEGLVAKEAARDASKKPIPVKTVSVVQEDVRRTSLQPATVHAFYRAEVRARVSGYVQKVQADIGDLVEEGATLAVIAVPELEKQRQIILARISLQKTEERRAAAGVELAEAHLRSSEAKFVQAQSELSRAEASLAAMEAEFLRTSDLVQRQSLESRVLDEVRKRRDTELANTAATTAAINSAEADVAVARAKLTSAKADLQVAEAETVIAERQLDELDVLMAYTTLKAPFSGLVTARTVDPGNLVRESSEVGRGQPQFVVSQVDRVRIRIPVPEVDAAFVTQGDAVTLRFPSFPAEEPLEAKVTRFTGDLDPDTRTMLVEVEVENPGTRLLPGMFGEASITLSTNVAANMLPARAVRFSEAGQAYVYVVGDDHSVTITSVTTGLDNGHFIEVKQGVESGQQVIDAHLKRFISGQKVLPFQN